MSQIMRRCVVTTIVGCMAVGMSGAGLHAQRVASDTPKNLSSTASAFNRLVNVDLDRVTLEQAINALAARAEVRVTYQSAQLDAITTPVTLHAKRLPLGVALSRVLQGTRLRAEFVTPEALYIRAIDGATSVVAQGSITGTVTDAATKRPLRGVTVSLDDAVRTVTTGEDGGFRLADISVGSHRVTVRMLGYARQVNTVTVGDGEAMVLNIALIAGVNTLDQVVVTGTIIPTELKAVPNAITVITAKQIEERGITKIDQLFRGDVPGLFAQNRGSNAQLDEVTMFSRGATALSFSSAGVDPNTGITNPIKTYVDGVELADSKYLSQIDPKSIERIEILTGPQASTIYGSNAINGVMQIFTKRGTTNIPQLTLNLLSGFVQNNFSSARTPQHDYSAQLNGIEGRMSYNVGGSWNYMGPWTPAKQLSRMGGFGGVRLELPTFAGRMTADLTLRRTLTQTLQRGSPSQTTTAYRETGWWTSISNSGLASPATRTLVGQTLGLILSYVPTPWWSHELGLGQDASDSEIRYTARGYLSVSDTTLVFSQVHTDRRSTRYVTTARISLASLSQLTVTAGADSWQNLTSSLVVLPQTLTGSLTNINSVSRQPSHNTGGFVQSQLGLTDRLFFTYGLRAEWNPNYGKEAQPNMAPRFGAAYTQELGPITAKLRASYGRATRPPASGLKMAQTVFDLYNSIWSLLSSQFLPYYGGVIDFYHANPDLAPEHQQGGEGGLELYLGSRGSLVVTRYNQTVDDLIAAPAVDSARTLVPCSAFSPTCNANSIDDDGYGYWRQYEYLNIGSIRNQGWELQGSANVGPFTTHGTYSWTKSRTIGVNAKYRSVFTVANGYTQYTPGATFQYLPEHTWALGATYSHVRSSIGLNVMGTGRTTNPRNNFFLQNLNSSIRLPQTRANVSNTSGYINFNAPYALADLMASHRFASNLEALLQVQNLADHYINDYDAINATLGRQVKAGLRLRVQ